MNMWNTKEKSAYTPEQRATAEACFWIAADSYDNSPHTYRDVLRAWERVVDRTDCVDTRIAARTLLCKQYAGFDFISGNLYYVDSTEHDSQPFTRTEVFQDALAGVHPAQLRADREALYAESAGKPRYVVRGFNS